MHGGASWHAAAVSPSDQHPAPDDPAAPTPRTVRVERLDGTGPDAGIRVVTLDRPERLNAMDGALIDDLHGVLDELAADPEVRVVVLTGAGRGFCAGLDLQSSPPTGIAASDGRGRAQRGMDLQQRIATLVPKLRGLRVPVIAAVNGAAAGGGLALALACDIRIAGAAAKFNVAFVRIGLSGCDIGVSWLLPRAIGTTRAYEMMLTGRMVHAEEAERIGLVVRTVPDEELLDEALATARAICANSPMGIWMTKEVMWSQLEVGSLAAGIDLENRTQILTSFTEDMGEAVTAFLGKRPPEYRNR
jgi:enoyl-CoA hydratase